MFGKKWRNGFGGVLAALAALVLTISAAEAGKMRLGMTTWVGYGPMFLARDKGFFKENGLDVELQIIEDAALYMAAIAAGKLDGNASTIDEIMKYRSQDFCFKAVVALDDSHGGDGVLVADRRQFARGPQGQSRSAMNEGSVSQFWFNILLKREGMTRKRPADRQHDGRRCRGGVHRRAHPGRRHLGAAPDAGPHQAAGQGADRLIHDARASSSMSWRSPATTSRRIRRTSKALVKGLYKAVEFIKTNQDEAYAIMAKGVGGYLEKPEDFAESAKGVRFYDQARNMEFFGTPEKGEAADLIKLGDEIWGGFQKLKMKVDYPTPGRYVSSSSPSSRRLSPAAPTGAVAGEPSSAQELPRAMSAAPVALAADRDAVRRHPGMARRSRQAALIWLLRPRRLGAGLPTAAGRRHVSADPRLRSSMRGFQLAADGTLVGAYVGERRGGAARLCHFLAGRSSARASTWAPSASCRRRSSRWSISSATCR